jgi:hypothetical protein
MASPARSYRLGFTPATVRAAILVAGALLSCVAGCRAVDNAQVDVLERELRQQEDYIYELEDYLMEYSEKLRQCRTCEDGMGVSGSTDLVPRSGSSAAASSPRRSGASRLQSIEPIDPIPAPPATSTQRPATERAAPPASTTSPATAPPATAPSGNEAEPEPPAAAPPAEVDPEALEGIELDIGPTSQLQWDNAPARAAASPPAEAIADDDAPFIPDPTDYQLDADPIAEDDAQMAAAEEESAAALAATEAEPTLEAPTNGTAAEPSTRTSAETESVAQAPTLPPPADPSRLVAERLQIRRIFSEAASADGAKPASLLVVVEALNATDEPVDANGEVSLMVMAGPSQDALKRIDRWDFTADEALQSWQSSQLGDGLHLELPLGAAELPEGSLELWARLVTSDGSKLLTRVPLDLSELTSLADANLAEPTTPAESATPLDNGPTQVTAASTATAIAAEPAPEPLTQWRRSSEPLDSIRVQSYSSTADGQQGQWTSQPPGGRAPLVVAPRVAAGQGGKPRWQQGAGEGSSTSGSESWAPFR